MRPSLLFFVLLAVSACRVDPVESRWNLDGDGDGAVYDDDCDDSDPDRYPGADEICDGVDQDCDGDIDEQAVDAPTWYLDGDKDGYGVDSDTVTACEQPQGYAAEGGDCDDDDDDFNPGATDHADDGIDQDCNGTDTVTCDKDLDGDGYGNHDAATILADDGSCDTAQNEAPKDGPHDCDDGDPTIHPGADEICDGQDNDCDDILLPGEADDDDDDYVSCAVDPGGWDGPTGILGGDDCDDGDATVHPGADELCDGQDNDCDGSLDADEADADSDGHVACTIDDDGWDDGPAPGEGDCDDGDDTVHPGADELCDGQLNDCDGAMLADEVDGDGDQYAGCELEGDWDGPGTVVGGGDCADGDPAVNPGADEICDGLDTDCSGSQGTDETDDDGDGWVECAPVGTIWDDLDGGGDCDDSEEFVYPGAPDRCDGLQNDCGDWSGGEPGALVDASEVDDDDDGYVECTWADEIESAGDWGNAETPPVVGDADCFDDDPMISPGLPELCDGGKNNDCVPSGDRTDSDVGTVSLQDASGTWSDESDLWSSGGTIALDVDGTWQVCPAGTETTDTWDVTLHVTADDVTVQGFPESGLEVTLDGGGSRRLVDIETDGTVLIEGLVLDHGDSSTDGAAIRVLGDIDGDPTVTLHQLTVRNAVATDDGGGLYVDAGTVDVTSSVFEDNDAALGGGAYVADGAVTFDGASLVTSNTANRGAGLYVAGGDVTVFGDLTANHASGAGTGEGGAAYLAGGTLHLEGTSEDRLRVDDNSSERSGGAVHTAAGGLTILDAGFANNAAGDHGGALYLDATFDIQQVAFDLQGVEFSANEAGPMNAGGENSGGAILLADGLLEAVDCSFTGNTADENGGAIKLEAGVFSATDTTIDGNTAEEGGGIYVSNATFSCTGTTTAATVTNNQGNTAGGGARIASGTTSSLTSTGCYWGSSDDGDDNSPSDVDVEGVDTYPYTDETFQCTQLGCGTL